MATALSHQQHQHQHHDQSHPHQHGNPPLTLGYASLNSSSGSSSGISSSPARSSPLTPSASSAENNYCKDCGVMFESSTSLEVHLSYHRANLLNKWGGNNNQDSPIPNNNNMEHKSGPYYPPHPPPSQHSYPPAYQHAFPPEQQYEHNHDVKPLIQGQRTPEEILDLDSNKVHVYNYPPNNFYRPYLMSQNQPHFLPPQEQQIYRHSFEFGHPQYPPPEIHPYQPPPQPPSQNQRAVVDFRGSFPPPHEQISQNSPEPETITQIEVNKKKKVKVEETVAGSSPGGPGATQKTKGWKGGECKRPKTYNCTACNKWFTSSGHLKRHYGTTLHKNSLRQKGENPDEHPTVTGKKTKEPKRSPSDEEGGHGSGGSGGDSSSTNLITPKLEEIPQQLTTAIVKSSSPVFNGSPRHHSDFYPNNSNSAPPPPIQPTYLPLYTNGGAQGQPSPYPMSMGLPHPQFHHHHYDNNQPNVYHGVPPTIYNGNYPHLINGEQLPPFSTVLSYENQYAPPGLYLQGISQGHPPPDTDSESGVHSVSTMSTTDHLNGESPEAVRSASTASGLEVSDSAPSSPSTGFSSGSDESPSSTVNERRLIKCPNCSKTFNRPCYLTQHTNSLHSGGRPFKCPTCGKRFLEEPALSDHVAKHESPKPYKCELCPKQFNHKTDLRRHLCLHTGEKPFKCEVCLKGFIRKDHMTKHSETHRKVKGQQQQNV